MAVTRGYVQRLTWLPGAQACLEIGHDPSMVELMYIPFPVNDSDTERIARSTNAQVLVQALFSGRLVDVSCPDGSGEVITVTLPAESGNPLRMDALEATQVVQDLAQSVPLVAERRTVVRAYLSYYGSAPITVRGELSVRSSPASPPTVIPSQDTVTLQPADAGDITITRHDVRRSLNFVLPFDSTLSGQLTMWLSSVTDTASGNPMAVSDQRRPTVAFHHCPPLRVQLIDFTYQWGMPPTTQTSRDIDVFLLASWLGRTYPVARVASLFRTVAATATPPFTAADVNAQLATIRAQDVSAGTDARTHYYGMVTDTGFWMRGSAASVPDTAPDPGVVASGPTGAPGSATSPANFTWDVDDSYGDWYGAHELSHTFGRKHPGFCGETADDLADYPFPAGQLSTTKGTFAGFDVGHPSLGGDPTQNLPMIALPGAQWHDVMTYCDRQWMSVYTHGGLRARLRAEDAMPSVLSDVRGREASAVNVVATVNLSRREGNVAFVNPVPNLAPTEPAPDSPVLLRVTARDGRGVREHPAPVKLDSELLPGEDRVGIVDVVLPGGPDEAMIELVMGGHVVDTFRAGGAPPVARDVRVVAVDSQRLSVTARLDRSAEEGHTFTVQTSTDHGRTWQTMGVGLRSPHLTLDSRQFASEQELLVRVIATNGFISSVGPSEVFWT
ncbi:hypothetical protein [Streptomyces sp. NPDC017890]|uniref:hypothetical protein n=1 Tax=Streptomyces sp. NPDC017890 TaxID=3365015 RepID=UPI0037900630